MDHQYWEECEWGSSGNRFTEVSSLLSIALVLFFRITS